MTSIFDGDNKNFFRKKNFCVFLCQLQIEFCTQTIIFQKKYMQISVLSVHNVVLDTLKLKFLTGEVLRKTG